jgi:poly(beta-D-mannuronate) lyase
VTPLWLKGAQHCRVTGCAVIRCNPADDTRTHWIRVSGADSRDNRIDHCYTEGKLKDGVVLTIEGDERGIATGTRVDHNHFKDVIRAVRNGMETIRVGDSNHSDLESRTLVEDNLFDNASGDVEVISSKSSRNTYRYNTFRGCDGGLVMRHGHRSRIEGNFFFGGERRASAGIRLHGTGHVVLNNYLAGLAQYSLSLPAGQSKYVRGGYEPTIDAVVAHNTIVEPRGPAIMIGGNRGNDGRDTAPQNTPSSITSW